MRRLAGQIRRFGWQLLAGATSLVIAFSAARGLAGGYEPVNDNSLIELRAGDVFTRHHPLLGTLSSASISTGIDVNHLGPLLFDVVAIPLRLLGRSAGIAVAIALLNIGVVWLVGFVTSRVGGATAAVSAQAITAIMVWTMGSELLYDPWQPNVLFLPFWLLLCCVWAVVAGRVSLLPLTVGVASFVMQTHLSYLFIAPTMVAFAVVSILWERRAAGDGAFDEVRRPALLSVGVFVVLWSQILVEQFFGSGRGNLTRLFLAGTGGGQDTGFESVRTGVPLALRMMSAVVALPPWWGRPGYDDSIPGSAWVEGPKGLVLQTPGLASLGVSVIGLTVVAAVVAVAWRQMRGVENREVVAAFRTLMMASAVAFVTLVITPIDILGISPHKVRWIWVIGIFLTYTVLLAALAAVPQRWCRLGLEGLGGLGVVALVLTLPTYVSQSGPLIFREATGSITNVRSQLDDYFERSDAPQSVLFDPDGIGFGEPYTQPIMTQLLHDGVDLAVDDPSLARQLGRDRVATPEEIDTLPLVYVRAGAEAVEIPDGAERIAFHDGDTSPYSINDVRDRAVAVFLVRQQG
ncbi:hypothetical protein [Ilumatobacter sp.]|uniref:hypothetical protein n=1 Tax=Ilumatobacter sp. TaxID=1967498 RepID=UPI0037509BB2